MCHPEWHAHTRITVKPLGAVMGFLIKAAIALKDRWAECARLAL